MPAVTVENVLDLERVERPTAESLERPVVSITTAPSGFEGEGFPVRRGFAGIPLEQVDPFIMMDQMGEVEYLAGESFTDYVWQVSAPLPEASKIADHLCFYDEKAEVQVIVDGEPV